MATCREPGARWQVSSRQWNQQNHVSLFFFFAMGDDIIDDGDGDDDVVLVR